MKTLAFFFALVVPLWGRIGETIAQCDFRYGKPIDGPSQITRNYSKNGIKIRVDFREGKAVALYYSAESSGFHNLLGKLSDDQIQELLKVNAMGGSWKEITEEHPTDSLFGKQLLRADGLVVASWDYAASHLILETVVEQQRKKLEYAAAEAKKAADEKHAAEKTVQGF